MKRRRPAGGAGPREFGQGGARRAVRADPACSRAGGGARRVDHIAEERDVRCELAYLGEDVSDDDATLQRRRAALKGAYEEEEEEEESEDDEAAPEAIDNRLPKRFRGRPRFPSRRARDWALDDAAGARDGDVASLGAAMARAVGRWASRSEEDDFAYHMRRARGVPRCLHAVEVGGLCFDF